jgi:Cu+-exporting ATPase
MADAERDLSRRKKFGDYEVSLSTTPVRVQAGKEARLEYLITKDGAPVTDLEPYLAAPMHIAIVLADLKTFLHEHGEVPSAEHAEHMGVHIHGAVPERFGPAITAEIVFPQKGLYHVFGEFRHGGKVVVSSFAVEAE